MLLTRISEITSEQHILVDTTSSSSSSSSSNDNSSQQQGRHAEDINRLDEQLRTLGQQLLRKQETLEEYLSERAALKVRLQDAQRRCQKYEEQVMMEPYPPLYLLLLLRYYMRGRLYVVCVLFLGIRGMVTNILHWGSLLRSILYGCRLPPCWSPRTHMTLRRI